MVDIGKYKEDLTQHLLSYCTDTGLLKGSLLSSPDIDEAWLRYAPSLYGDAVRNFNDGLELAIAHMDVREVVFVGVQHVHRHQDSVEHTDCGHGVKLPMRRVLRRVS